MINPKPDLEPSELSSLQLFEALANAYLLVTRLRAEASARGLAFYREIPVGMGRAESSSSVFGLQPPSPPANSTIRKP